MAPCVCSTAGITTYMAWDLRQHHVRCAGKLPLSLVTAWILLGAMALKRLDEQVLRTLIGALLTGYGSTGLLARPRA